MNDLAFAMWRSQVIKGTKVTGEDGLTYLVLDNKDTTALVSAEKKE